MNKDRTLIPLEYFFDEQHFSNEKEVLFSKSWLFACFAHEIASHDEYVTKDLLGKSVVIKNFSGKLKAFHNVCLHRFSKICLNERGRGLLQCAYHGWTYNEEGVPYAIPQQKKFNADCIRKQKLTEYTLAIVGQFVFINFSDESSDIKDFLGEKNYDFLLLVSDALGKSIDVNVIDIKANWKIVVENTLEDYHVQKVHPESLFKVGIKESIAEFDGLHSSSKMKFELSLLKSKKIVQLYEDRAWHVMDYKHQLIFPNLTIASAFGATISIQVISPLTARTTRFISYVFAAKIANDGHPIVEAFNDNALEFNRLVFDEDKMICEAVQLGVEQAGTKQGFLSTDESRVWAFEKNYMEWFVERK